MLSEFQGVVSIIFLINIVTLLFLLVMTNQKLRPDPQKLAIFTDRIPRCCYPVLYSFGLHNIKYQKNLFSF